MFKADEVIFGEDLGFVTQVVELPESEKRFHIDKQTDDMMNNMLSTIPNNERNERVYAEIHAMINRFKELREEFSDFDLTANTINPKEYESNDKPLVESLETLDKKHYWMLPVVSMKKKLYTLGGEQNESEYVIEIPMAKSRIDDTEVYNKFKENEIGYNDYLKNSRTFSTPFISRQNNKKVDTPLIAVVNNEDDFKTSTLVGKKILNESIMISGQKKFFTQQYVVSQDIINPIDETIIKATPNDEISINSFMMLPDSTLRFSHINAPSTSLMRKTSLNNNFLQYWRMFKPQTKVATMDVKVDENEETENRFLDKITHYKPEESIYDDDDKYRQYLENIVPKTRDLFRHVQSQMEGTQSIRNAIRYLEPFAIEPSVITHGLYRDIRAYVTDKVREYTQQLEESLQILSSVSVDSADVISGLRLMFETSRNIYDDVMDGYGINESDMLSDDEIYTRVMAIDHGRLLHIGISFTSIRLMILHDAPCIEDYQKLAREKREAKQQEEETKSSEKDDCNKYVLTKKYLSLDELESDNNQEVFFDKRYDNTYYDLEKEYTIQLESMEDDGAREQFLSEKLQEVNGLSPSKSMREARAMLRKKREVMDGEYAILQSEDTEPRYYRRENNVWVLDTNIDEGLLTDETKLFCNFNEKCVQKDSICNSLNNEQISIETEVEKQIIDEFENALKSTKDEHMKKIMKIFKIAKKNVSVLRVLHQQKMYSDKLPQDIFFEQESSMSDVLSSPYANLRNAILEQSDFAKKQQDIRKFISHFTRKPNVQEDESPFWLYCIKTNVKLLPSFYEEISQSFADGLVDYMDVIGKICDERGELGDDGSVWVDKHSGYIITTRSFDAQEGYTEEGFRISTRALLDDDPTIPENMDTTKTYTDPDTLLIMRVVDDMEKFMGIHLDEQGKDFIRRLVKESLRELLMKESSYKKLIKEEKEKKPDKNKKFASYEQYKNEMILELSLSYLLIYIQTSIPQMKYGKQYPGCSRSFSGYPMDENGTKGIEYISCVANKIKRSVEPWNTLSNAKKLSKKLMKILQSLTKKSEIKSRLENKRRYLISNENETGFIDELAIAYSTSSLLPILIPVKVSNIMPTQKEFFQLLDDDMQVSSKDQHAKINAMNGKKIHVAVRMQYLIEKAIKNEVGSKALLTTAAEEPYVENACCWDEETRPFKYFAGKVSELSELNNESRAISKLLKKVKMLSSARILFSSLETKIKFPKVSSLYSEETKYRAVATLCGSSDMVNEDQEVSICADIEFNTKTLEDKIKELENNGLKYTGDAVMDLVASRNAKHIFEWKSAYAPEQDDDDFPEPLREFIDSQTDNNNQIEVIETIKSEMDDIMKTSLSKKEYNMYLGSLATINEYFETDITNTNFDERSFSLNSLRYMCLVIPSLLSSPTEHYLGQVPKHWQLSNFHVNDIEGYTKKKAEGLQNVMKKIVDTNFEMNEDAKNKLRSIFRFFRFTLTKNYSIQNIFEYCLLSSVEVYIESTRESKVSFMPLVNEMLKVIANEIKNVIYDYKTLERKINASKEKEKMNILKRLENMTDEEREIDNQKKYSKLGEWGKGLQKNLRIYDQTEYDKERDVLDEPTGELSAAEQGEIDEIVMYDDDNPDEGQDGDEIY